MKTAHCPAAWSSRRGRRSQNEDAVIGNRLPDGRQLVALADGMGGHSKGEIASATAVEALAGALAAGDELPEAVRAANRMVRSEAARRRSSRGMGTTLVALLRAGTTYRIANIGDSRAYRVDGGGIEQITVDHSFVAEAIHAGGLSREEAARSPWRNAVTRSLGTDPEVDADLFGPFEAEGAAHAIVLCSDGLYRALSDEAIRRCVLSADDVRAAADALCGLALENGSDDNVSVAVLEFGTMPRRASDAHPARRHSPARARERQCTTVAWESVTFFTLVAAFVLFLAFYLLSL